MLTVAVSAVGARVLAVVRLRRNLEIAFADSRTVAKDEAGDVIEECQQDAYKMLDEAEGNTEKSINAIES